MGKIEPIKPIPIPDGVDYPAYIGKMNELINGYNELIAAYNGHKHQYECEEGRRQTQAPRRDTPNHRPPSEPEGEDNGR